MQVKLQVTCEYGFNRYLQKSVLAGSCTCITRRSRRDLRVCKYNEAQLRVRVSSYSHVALVEKTPAPPKAKVPKVTELNKLTSSESRGILFTVEGIDPKHFDTLVTKNFSSWEDVRTTLGVEPAVIVRLQDKLADRPEVKGWIEKPDDFPAESSQPDVAPPESTAKSAISNRHVAQGLTSELLEMHKDKRHATYEAMRSLKVRKSRARANTHTFGSPSTV